MIESMHNYLFKTVQGEVILLPHWPAA